MARAGSELNRVIKKLNTISSKSFQQEIQDKLRKKSKTLFLEPLKKRLLRGVSGDGSILPPYSPRTILEKKKKGIASSPTNLRFTGDWYRSMFVHFGGTGQLHIIEIQTKETGAEFPTDKGIGMGRTIDEKTIYLKRKYGASILTLTEQEEEDITGFVTQLYINGIGLENFNPRMTL